MATRRVPPLVPLGLARSIADRGLPFPIGERAAAWGARSLRTCDLGNIGRHATWLHAARFRETARRDRRAVNVPLHNRTVGLKPRGTGARDFYFPGYRGISGFWDPGARVGNKVHNRHSGARSASGRYLDAHDLYNKYIHASSPARLGFRCADGGFVTHSLRLWFVICYLSDRF